LNVPIVRLAEVRDGLARGEFFLEYQPIVSLADDRCLGAEALIRWRRGDHVIPPSEFIPLVENTAVSGFITYWVMETVMAELGAWLKENPDVYVSINAPPEILGRGGIEYAAVKSGLMSLSSQVMLEITERGIPDPLGLASINDRGGTGVRVALDDVTLAGGVSMAVLMRCPFDAIKLDKSLIDQITPDAPRPDWMNAVGTLEGSGAPMRVIAEGVDTEYQVAMLRAANVYAAQGFYFSRPLDTASLFAFHRERNQK